MQWVREAYKNSVEAGATRILFGVEWQGVEQQGIYRRVIAHNGVGIPHHRMVSFFNTFGGGGKPIGGEHENYGVGFKTSILPWNSAGVVVISRYQGNAAMIWIQQFEDGEYGLRHFYVDGREGEPPGYIPVVAPYAEDPNFDASLELLHAIDWQTVGPDWARGEHGTHHRAPGRRPRPRHCARRPEPQREWNQGPDHLPQSAALGGAGGNHGHCRGAAPCRPEILATLSGRRRQSGRDDR